MKKLGITILWLVSFYTNSELISQEGGNVSFKYDENGKVIERKVISFPSARLFFKPENTSPLLLKEAEFLIYPNPTNGIVNISGKLPDGIDFATITILNYCGQNVFQSNYDGDHKELDLNHLSNGVYLLEIKKNNTSINSYKLILTK